MLDAGVSNATSDMGDLGPQVGDSHAHLDERIVHATQAGLPLDPTPYHRVAETLGVDPEQVKARLAAMLAQRKIRRIAAVPNHFRLGYVANGMSVWDVPDVSRRPSTSPRCRRSAT